jgi:hypothetical protein
MHSADVCAISLQQRSVDQFILNKLRYSTDACSLHLIQNRGATAVSIVFAIISALAAVFGIYLLVDALWSGIAYVPPAGRYFRNLNPWMYWIGIRQIALFVYFYFFTFFACVR